MDGVKLHPELKEQLWYETALRDGIVWYHGEVNISRTALCTYALAQVVREKGKAILAINSEGGDVAQGLMMHDFIISLRKQGYRVDTFGIGEVCSMALIILQAGERRILAPNTIVLLHEIASWAVGKISEQQDTMAMLKKLEDRILAILSERSGRSRHKIRKLMERRDYWMTADEAVKLGFADEVTDKVCVVTLPPVEE
jgi:ATP-dependent Clp endopeptidase proteolytic subunit ClpP